MTEPAQRDADASARHTLAPDEPPLIRPPPLALREGTPPEGSRARPSIIDTDRIVAIADLHSRRMLRGFAVGCLTALTCWFESRGHSVPGLIIGAVVALGIGPDAAIAAVTRAPKAVAGAGGALLLLAFAGEALGAPLLSMLSALGAGAIPAVIDRFPGGPS